MLLRKAVLWTLTFIAAIYKYPAISLILGFFPFLLSHCHDFPNEYFFLLKKARSHASEAASSFIMQGLLDFLTSNYAVARELRRYLIFKVIPVMNPDGVFLGNTMGNLLGQDLNRCWQEPNSFSQPTVHAGMCSISNFW